MARPSIVDTLAPPDILAASYSFSGYSTFLMAAESKLDVNNVAKTMWPIVGKHTFMTTAAPLYVSSTSAADVGVIIRVSGLDSERSEVFGIAVVNGQSQVEILDEATFLPISMIRVNLAIVVGTTSDIIPAELAGTVYVAEADTLTAGVPNTQTKIRSAMAPGSNATNVGIYTVPKNKIAVFHGFNIVIDSNKATTVTVTATVHNSNVPISLRFSPIKNALSNFEYHTYLISNLISEGTDIEMSFVSAAAATTITAFVSLVMIDKNYQGVFDDSFFGIFS